MVYPTLVEESRVSDIINQEDDYLVVYEDSRKRIINRNHVVYVDET